MPLSVEQSLNEFAEKVISNAQRELGTTKPRKSYEATWRKGKLLSYQVKMKRRRSDNSGALRESLDYDVQKTGGGYLLTISSLDYGIFVNEGREAGKGIPPLALQKWLRTKRIRPKDKDGKFLKESFSAYSSLAFLINRKIKQFGIEANPFMTMSLERFQPELAGSIGEQYAKELADQIRKKYSKENYRP
jgi:hypothetical protein